VTWGETGDSWWLALESAARGSGGGERQNVAEGRRERRLDSYNGCSFNSFNGNTNYGLIVVAGLPNMRVLDFPNPRDRVRI
jgi:hypothetical protein